MLYLLKLESPQLNKGLFFASDATCKKTSKWLELLGPSQEVSVDNLIITVLKLS